MTRPAEVPAGFVRFSVARAEVTCTTFVADAVRDALRSSGGTLYQYAEQHAAAVLHAGRGVVYAVPLPGDDQAARVVVRRNRHGGLLGRIRGDLFLPPTRAPHELRTSERLRHSGVPTPQMLAFVIYSASAGLLRADVMTREVAGAIDLSHPLRSTDPAHRARALDATARLVVRLSAVGARHQDLNVKNVLLHHTPADGTEALVLDVDRVTFDDDVRHALEQNLARLLRSARKWQQQHDAFVTDAELTDFAAKVREAQNHPSS